MPVSGVLVHVFISRNVHHASREDTCIEIPIALVELENTGSSFLDSQTYGPQSIGQTDVCAFVTIDE